MVLTLTVDVGNLDPETLEPLAQMKQRLYTTTPLKPRPRSQRQHERPKKALKDELKHKKMSYPDGAFCGDGGADTQVNAGGRGQIYRIVIPKKGKPEYEQMHDDKIAVLAANIDKQPPHQQDAQRNKQRDSISKFTVRNQSEGKSNMSRTEKQAIYRIAMEMLLRRTIPHVPTIEWLDEFNSAVTKVAIYGRPDVEDIDLGGT